MAKTDSGASAAKTVEDLEREFGIEPGDDGDDTPPDTEASVDLDDLMDTGVDDPEPEPSTEPETEPTTDTVQPGSDDEAVGGLDVGGLVGSMSLGMVGIKELKPAPGFRKVNVKEAEFITLVSSIKTHGILSPLCVKDGKVYGGRRRLEAAKLAGLKQVPVIEITAEGEHATVLISLLDNIQRKNLNPIEEAQAYKVMIDKGIVKNQTALSAVLGVSPAAITQKMAVLELDATLKKALTEDKITASTAYELRSAEPEVIKNVLNHAKKTGKRVTKKTAREKVTGHTAVMAILPEKAPAEIKSARITADGVRLVIDLAHPQKTWKGGELLKILTEVASDCGNDLDKAFTIARKEVK